MRTFYLIQVLNPDTKAVRGYVLREGSSNKSYRIVKADKATLYTTKSGVANSKKHVMHGLGIKPPPDMSRWLTQNFINQHLKTVEVKALLIPADGFLDQILR